MEGEQAITSFSEYAQKIKLVDAQISHHLGLLLELRGQRNALVPISQLPTEILCEVFFYVRSFYEEIRGRWSKTLFTTPDLKWIAISQVSRNWRTAALNEPRLWTNPPLDNPTWNKIMLQRSRSATLPRITLDHDDDHPDCISATILELPRIQNFSICATDPVSLRSLLFLLPRTSPELEELSINSIDKTISPSPLDYLDMSDRKIDEAVELPVDLFTGSSGLRRLQLAGLTVDLKSHLFSSSLETLSLTQIPVGSRPAHVEFETLLRSLGRLKSLTLINACPSTTPNSPPRTITPFCLRLLGKLTLGATIPEFTYFLGTFSVPAITQASITLKYERQIASTFEQLSLLIMESHLSRLIGSDSDVKRLELQQNGRSLAILPVTLDEANKKLHPRSRDTSRIGPLVINVNMEITHYDHIMRFSSPIMFAICRSFYPTGLSELDISLMDDFSPDALLSAFGDIPRLQVIIVSDRALVDALSQSSHDRLSKANASTPIMFAQLQHIVLHGISFGRRGHNGHLLSVKALRRCLEVRRRIGAPIRSIVLEGCEGLSQQAVNVLKGEVEHVVWASDTEHDGYNFYSNCEWLS